MTLPLSWSRLSLAGLRPVLRLMLTALVVLQIFGAGAAPLPEAALKRAREAEKAAAAGEWKQAIAAYEKLDTEFPGHAAISLRLAQLHDEANLSGPALFYYRRYVTRAGGTVREEARARLSALELTPGAPEAAKELAAKKKEKTAPLPPEAPEVKHSVAALTEDGVLRPLRGREDLEKLARGEQIPAATPTPTPPTVVVAPGMTPGAFSVTRPPRTPAGTRAPGAPAPASSASAAGDEDAALASAFARRAPGDAAPLLSPATTRTVIVIPDRRTPPPAAAASALGPDTPVSSNQLALPAVTPETLSLGNAAVPSLSQMPTSEPGAGSSRGGPMIVDIAPAELSAAGGGELERAIAPAAGPGSGTSRAGAPAPARSAPPADGAGFFSLKQIGGASARIKLSNTVPNSTLTFAAIPDAGGAPVQALISNGESRVFDVAPGSYEVVVSAATNDYPPAPLLDRRFEHDFAAGWQYTRRLSTELIQELK